MSMSIGQKKVKPILCVESLKKRRPRLVHYVSEDLLCKEKTCPTRIRLALQGKEARPHCYKSPNILLTSRYA